MELVRNRLQPLGVNVKEFDRNLESVENGLKAIGENVGKFIDNAQQSEAETDAQYKYSIESTVTQCCVTFVTSLIFFTAGMLLATPVVVIGAIINAEVGLSITLEQSSYYIALFSIIRPIGNLIGGYLPSYIGRKVGMQIMNISTIISFLFLSKASSIEMLNVSSVLMGISIAIADTPKYSYLGEVTEPRTRGISLFYCNLNFQIGFTMIFVSSYFTDWRTTSLISISVPTLSFILFFLIPESPFWLLQKKRPEEALNSLCWLRGWVNEEIVSKEFQSIQKNVKTSYLNSLTNIDGIKNTAMDATNVITGRVSSMVKDTVDTAGGIVMHPCLKLFLGCFSCLGCCFNCSQLKSLLESSTLRPFILLISYEFITNCATASGTRAYVINILDELHMPWSSKLTAVFISISGTVGSIFGAILLKYTGKRWLSLISLMLTAITTFASGICISFKDDVASGIIAFVFLANAFSAFLGCLHIPWILVGEVYPMKTKALASGITTAVYAVQQSFFGKTYPDLKMYLDTGGCFIFFSVLGFIGIIYIWFYLPETEGKSLTEIQMYFSKKPTNLNMIGDNIEGFMEQSAALLNPNNVKELVSKPAAMVHDSVTYGVNQAQELCEGISDLSKKPICIVTDQLEKLDIEQAKELCEGISDLSKKPICIVTNQLEKLDIEQAKELCEGIVAVSKEPVTVVTQQLDKLDIEHAEELCENAMKPVTLATDNIKVNLGTALNTEVCDLVKQPADILHSVSNIVPGKVFCDKISNIIKTPSNETREDHVNLNMTSSSSPIELSANYTDDAQIHITEKHSNLEPCKNIGDIVSDPISSKRGLDQSKQSDDGNEKETLLSGKKLKGLAKKPIITSKGLNLGL